MAYRFSSLQIIAVFHLCRPLVQRPPPSLEPRVVVVQHLSGGTPFRRVFQLQLRVLFSRRVVIQGIQTVCQLGSAVYMSRQEQQEWLEVRTLMSFRSVCHGNGKKVA